MTDDHRALADVVRSVLDDRDPTLVRRMVERSPGIRRFAVEPGAPQR